MKVIHVFTISATAKSFFDGQFKYLTDKGHEIIVVSQSENDPVFEHRNNIKEVRIPIERKISLGDDIKAIRQLISLFKKERCEMVVGHTPKGAMVAMIASWFAGIPLRVYYRHGLIYTTAKGVKRFVFKTVERMTALFSNKIVNVSPSLSKLAVKDHLNGEWKQVVIGRGTCGGIDAKTLFNPELLDSSKLVALREKYGIKPNDYVVGFCGRLCRDKGIIELYEGFRLFCNNNPDIPAKLLLIGRWDTRDVLPEDKKRLLESDSRVVLTGGVPKNELPSLYSLMDVFVFPSYREGFGMCVLEASAMEKPILVSRCHGCVDSIEEHKTGEYIDITPEDIASHLREMHNLELRVKMGLEGRKFVLENFDFSVMFPMIEKLYKEFDKDSK
ncbi:MAG: glycosyltransferase [Muribaculaceae bacterium]|nr:glycosyltransferase [Muribaculaceae bacterium]